ncbi:MarR family winged helix-turn-helix transcriptional regulator [Variovorax terrae]|uniref:MarR family transcriptional regulator n=1 Tax=Variovorax terrae TaxID=2923278 RepID=A0A9X1VRT1_9BURK|nr:MarR family transcriptional regulator [Variovorax terrae]MCJ0762148.1 MarR family transcriptional regulator [Variovorax terrae]
MTDALTLGLRLAEAHARLGFKLDDELGTFHGLSFGDFLLLHRLALAEGRRLPVDELARPLGLTLSAAVRRLLPLEKTGLLDRVPGAAGRRAGEAVLRPAGQALLQGALETVQAVCREATRAIGPDEAAATAHALEALSRSRALDL